MKRNRRDISSRFDLLYINTMYVATIIGIDTSFVYLHLDYYVTMFSALPDILDPSKLLYPLQNENDNKLKEEAIIENN